VCDFSNNPHSIDVLTQERGLLHGSVQPLVMSVGSCQVAAPQALRRESVRLEAKPGGRCLSQLQRKTRMDRSSEPAMFSFGRRWIAFMGTVKHKSRQVSACVVPIAPSVALQCFGTLLSRLLGQAHKVPGKM